MADTFSPSFWLDKKVNHRNTSFDDPMERHFCDRFGVDTFAFVHNLYSFSGCQWEVANAYAYLHHQLDILWRDMLRQYHNKNDWIYVDFDSFGDEPATVVLPTACCGRGQPQAAPL